MNLLILVIAGVLPALNGIDAEKYDSRVGTYFIGVVCPMDAPCYMYAYRDGKSTDIDDFELSSDGVFLTVDGKKLFWKAKPTVGCFLQVQEQPRRWRAFYQGREPWEFNQ